MNGLIAQTGSAEEMFRLAVEACPNGMVMVDHDGKMVMVNTEIGLELLPYLRDVAGNPVPVVIFAASGVGQTCTEQVEIALSKATSTLENLGAAVRGRLALLSARRVEEVA
jgi:hypothetical protein